MDRLFVLLALALMLALAPLHSAGEEQPVFFSLLFPQLMPEGLFFEWFAAGSGSTPGEAVAL